MTRLALRSWIPTPPHLPSQGLGLTNPRTGGNSLAALPRSDNWPIRRACQHSEQKRAEISSVCAVCFLRVALTVSHRLPWGHGAVGSHQGTSQFPPHSEEAAPTAPRCRNHQNPTVWPGLLRESMVEGCFCLVIAPAGGGWSPRKTDEQANRLDPLPWHVSCPPQDFWEIFEIYILSDFLWP